jgi:hypothetical protein
MLHRRFATAACLTALAAIAFATPASARIIDVGKLEGATPTCPGTPCLAVSRTTGYQVKVGDDRTAYVVPHDGKIVAWTIALGAPNDKQVKFFDDHYGPSSANLTLLRPGKRLFARVVAQSPAVRLQPYFGQTVQLPLDQALNVRKGWIIALTVPSWAPALTPLLEDGSSWRAARPKDGCNDTDTQTAQTRRGQLAQYRCLYKARLAYSATLITAPQPTAKPAAATRR